jgi:prephenate dehydrogenase
MMQAIGKAIRPHVVMLDLTRQKGQGLRLADEYMENGHYVGVVPVLAASMLSDSRHDLEAARVDLFANSVFCYTPSVKADPVAVESAVSFGRILGASPFFLDANEFDSLLQGVETVPGLLAAALFQAVRKSRGWTDMLRFSGLSFATATADLENEDLAQLAFLDEEATLRWLDSVLLELGEIRRLVADGNKERLELLLQDLLGQRAVWLHRREENDWSEDIDSPDIDTMTIGNQMFGGFLRRRKDDKKS